MSVLDRAFIRAFNKGAGPALARAENSDLPSQSPDTAGRDQIESPEDHLIEAMCGGQVYRIDQAHPAWTDKFPQPHIQLIPSGVGADLAFASPYHEICPPTFPDLAQTVEVDQEATDVSPADTPEMDSLSEATHSEAQEASSDCDEPNIPAEAASEQTMEPAAVEPELESDPPVADATASLRHAAALRMPATLQLPEVFQLPGDETDDQQQADNTSEFSPDWEVDRFVWPPICQELMEAQSRYFQHVGERLMAATQESDHVIMISGSRRGEGRSTLAMCLARCAAEAGIKVALVDADLDNAQFGTRLGMQTPCNWVEVVASHAPLQEAAVASVEDRLTVFPLTDNKSVDIPPGDGRLIMFVRRISAHYPLVIIDTGPLGSDETHLFESEAACPIDTAIVVRDLRNTAEQGSLATAQRLQQGGIQAVGIAENFRGTE